MIARLTFVGIVAFWLAMNFWLWRIEYGTRGGDTPVPVQLVWRKILTAPDASSLSVYQNGERMGYCELSTSVGQQMATYDEDKPPPDGISTRAGYQVHLAGNVSLGDFTNRVKFDGRLQFSRLREWRDLNFKITVRQMVIDIYASATNQNAHVKFSNEGMLVLERDLAFADLQDPATAMRTLTGNLGEGFFSLFEPLDILPETTQRIQWEARRTRVKMGNEAVPVYRLETSVLGRAITIDVSTLGEILRVELPDNISARIDEWSKP